MMRTVPQDHISLLLMGVSHYKHLGFLMDGCFKEKHINELTKTLKAKLAFFYRNNGMY